MLPVHIIYDLPKHTLITIGNLGHRIEYIPYKLTRNLRLDRTQINLRINNITLAFARYLSFQGSKATLNKNILKLKLGYSHSVYFEIPELSLIRTYSRRPFNGLAFLTFNSNVLVFPELIAAAKRPDSYKGKGIIYLNQVLKLKKSKKVQ